MAEYSAASASIPNALCDWLFSPWMLSWSNVDLIAVSGQMGSARMLDEFELLTYLLQSLVDRNQG